LGVRRSAYPHVDDYVAYDPDEVSTLKGTEKEMKLTPWKQPAPTATLRTDFDEWMKDVFEEKNWFNRLPATFQRKPMPAMNLADTEKAFLATVELPGLELGDIDIQLVGRQLLITGERKWEKEEQDKDFYRVESQYGSFRRAIELPDGLKLDPEVVEASYDKGMLEIRIPKLEPKPTTHIKVRVKVKQ
jgi:HSP20 family protein